MVSKRTRNVHEVELVRNGFSATQISTIELRGIRWLVKCSILIASKEVKSSAFQWCQRVQNLLKFRILLKSAQIFKSVSFGYNSCPIHYLKFDVCSASRPSCKCAVGFLEALLRQWGQNRQFLIVTVIELVVF